MAAQIPTIKRPFGSPAGAIATGNRPFGSPVGSIATGRRPFGSPAGSIATGRRPFGSPAGAIATGNRPFGSPAGSIATGNRPFGSPAGAIATGNRPFGSPAGSIATGRRPFGSPAGSIATGRRPFGSPAGSIATGNRPFGSPAGAIATGNRPFGSPAGSIATGNRPFGSPAGAIATGNRPFGSPAGAIATGRRPFGSPAGAIATGRQPFYSMDGRQFGRRQFGSSAAVTTATGRRPFGSLSTDTQKDRQQFGAIPTDRRQFGTMATNWRQFDEMATDRQQFGTMAIDRRQFGIPAAVSQRVRSPENIQTADRTSLDGRYGSTETDTSAINGGYPDRTRNAVTFVGNNYESGITGDRHAQPPRDLQLTRPGRRFMTPPDHGDRLTYDALHHQPFGHTPQTRVDRNALPAYSNSHRHPDGFVISPFTHAARSPLLGVDGARGFPSPLQRLFSNHAVTDQRLTNRAPMRNDVMQQTGTHTAAIYQQFGAPDYGNQRLYPNDRNNNQGSNLNNHVTLTYPDRFAHPQSFSGPTDNAFHPSVRSEMSLPSTLVMASNHAGREEDVSVRHDIARWPHQQLTNDIRVDRLSQLPDSSVDYNSQSVHVLNPYVAQRREFGDTRPDSAANNNYFQANVPRQL